MKNRSLYLTIIIIIGFFMFQLGNKTSIAKFEQDLTTLVSVLQDEHILITEWSLYSRETLEKVTTEQERAQFVADLKKKFSDWSWSETRDADHYTITATPVSSNYTEKIKIVSTETLGQLHTYAMYEVKGQKWDQQSEGFVSKEWQDRLLDIFTGKASTFSCVKGEFSDKMDEALPTYMNRLLASFNAEEIEALEEDNFLSTSAFSPLFSGTISKDHDMNLQLGLRKPDGMGGNTTLVVGTPIITIEY
ncbi:TATA-box binding [Mesobacillus persicus]|uniref:TATA-box binding n=1 Tax=Mesobacillus persicus TaxID=930146 RepID=A0A1H8H3L8_9BACI|nr:YwmB family TATA-box binding protein [Mesobacillus persicus]SEN50836.1 TATA-box binding [Mesobacillus persicus]